MTDINFNVWDEAGHQLHAMKIRHTFSTLEARVLDYSIRCVEWVKKVRGELTRAELAIRETEKYVEIERRR